VKDHIDNAIIGALLEGAEAGTDPRPLVFATGCSHGETLQRYLELRRTVGPIPEEWLHIESPLHWLVDRHAAMKADLLADVERFRRRTARRLLGTAEDGTGKGSIIRGSRCVDISRLPIYIKCLPFRLSLMARGGGPWNA
jgi:hypothetical protein